MKELNLKLDDAINRDDILEVKELIESGADIEFSDSFGCTPLINAAWVASAEIVEYLLGLGANINHRDNDGKTALEKVMEIGHNDYGHKVVIEVLERHESK